MDHFEVADALYQRAFPIVVVLCAFAGALGYAAEAHLHALACFLSVGIALRLNSIVENRRSERAERLAGLGWERLRGPVRAAQSANS